MTNRAMGVSSSMKITRRVGVCTDCMDDIGGNGNACGLHVFSVYLGDERPIQPDQNMGGEVPVRTGDFDRRPEYNSSPVCKKQMEAWCPFSAQ